jgi:hypothetical protein
MTRLILEFLAVVLGTFTPDITDTPTKKCVPEFDSVNSPQISGGPGNRHRPRVEPR